ncbi:HMG box protein [Ophiocordyceps camponoti-floridani]|uniref:HMG box protein n=1 Tax=Ophiocordyceps camponoti-floridani TaxID=2030778 RepID=A0A8H4Q485_9HYPO|nr:HMG box protein [Ophiocordyceps camponoti-floridani]
MFMSLSRVVARRVTSTGLVWASVSARRVVPVLSARAFSGSAFVLAPTTAKTKKAPAAKKAAATKKSTAGSKKSTATAAKKKKAPAKAKAKAKKPAAAAKKKKKVVVKKSKKKQMTPEEREKAKLRYLKMLSLWRMPRCRPATPWSLYVANNFPAGNDETSTAKFNRLFAEYSKSTAAEMEAFKAQTEANEIYNKKELEKWIKSYPVEVVYLANIARRRLVRILKRGAKFIPDDRQPKRPRNAMASFLATQLAGKKGAGDRQTDIFKSAVEKWKAMSDAEKKPYHDQAKAESERCKGRHEKYTQSAIRYWENNMPKRRPTVPRTRADLIKAKAKAKTTNA